MEMEKRWRESIRHPLHPHALVLNDKIKEACCSACLEWLSFDPSFSCGECNTFHLHEKCAKAPSQITSLPFHPYHPFLTLHSTPPSSWRFSFICDLCREERKMFLYRCSSCDLSLDFKCALLLHNIDIDFREVKHFAHHHPLSFIENPKDKDVIALESAAACFLCQKPLVDSSSSSSSISIYACLQSQCRFYLHKKCFPSRVFHHPCHRIHPFILEFSETLLFCKVCQTENAGLFLRCYPCKIDIHIECAWPPPIIEDKPHHHHHPFLRLCRDVLFTCDACGIEGNYVSYVCLTCNFQVHPNCISLPYIIKNTRHYHYITHKYFLQQKDHDQFDRKQEQDCQLCFKQVREGYGNFSCLKKDCDFVAHVKCAMERGMYDVISDDEANDQYEESSENLSSIIRVIEWNEQGEATIIEHFSHKEHYLTLMGNKIIKEDDHDHKRCDGCMLSIFISISPSSSSSSFYYSCSQSECEFLLHKTCAELPRKKRQWFHLSLTTLNLVDIAFVCHLCYRICSGFVYKSDDGYSTFCVRCARISHTLSLVEQQGRNKHSIFFDFNLGKCNACGAYGRSGAFKCKDCNLALDFRCITLPETSQHKSDKHNLTLAFHDDNDDPEQHYCDVCEEKRNPNHWFYHCAICDNAAHPICILGQFSFVKMGATLPTSTSGKSIYNPHPHPLIFAKKNYEICSKCGKRFRHEVALECKDCASIVHFNCRSA